MKSITITILLVIFVFYVGCTENNNPTISKIEGKYAGTFKITQDNYIQQGNVTFIFSDSTFEQEGQIESPANTNISDRGSFRLENENSIFNAGRELHMVVYPSWSLIGSFKYMSINNIITLVQETNSMRYEIKLYKND